MILVWVTSVTGLQVESYAFFFIYPGKLLKDSSAQGRSLTTEEKASARCYMGNQGSSGLVGLSFLGWLLPVSQKREKAPPGVERVRVGTVGKACKQDFTSSR